jgi:hypothetical protein
VLVKRWGSRDTGRQSDLLKREQEAAGGFVHSLAIHFSVSRCHTISSGRHLGGVVVLVAVVFVVSGVHVAYVSFFLKYSIIYIYTSYLYKYL